MSGASGNGSIGGVGARWIAPGETGRVDRAEAVLADLLFDDPSLGVWAFVDGASCVELRQQLHAFGAENECLLRGELADDLAAAAPYVVRLKRGDGFTAWLLERGWGEHWFIVVRAAGGLSLRDVRRHARTIMLVNGPEGQKLHFRFYDPRAFIAVVPTFDAAQVARFFGPIGEVLVEDGSEGGRIVRYFHESGELRRDVVTVGASG